VSRKDAKAAKKIPLSSPFGKGGKRGILSKWRPAEAVQDMLGARMVKHLKLKRKDDWRILRELRKFSSISSTKEE
jgi:hypothetical protein